MVHAVLPQMRRQKDGLIINITSIAGKRTISDLAGSSYCASKFAMNSLVRAHHHASNATNVFASPWSWELGR